MHAQEAMWYSGKAVTDTHFHEASVLGEEKEAVHKRRKKDTRELQ
jgi:hypothetical protein